MIVRKAEIVRNGIINVQCPETVSLRNLFRDHGCMYCKYHDHIGLNVVYCKWEGTNEHTNSEQEERGAGSQKT